MSKKVLIRKQMGGVTQQVMVDQSKPRTDARSDLATLRGGAYGLNPDTGRQGFIPGAQLPGAAPTRMQRLGAGANLAGRGLAAALTGLQTAYGLQGGNVGALGSVKDQYRANVGGLTGGSPTEAQQGQDMAMAELARRNAEAAQNAMMQQVNPAPTNQSGPTGSPLPGQTQGTPLGQLPPANLPPQPPVPAQTPPAAPAPPVPAQTPAPAPVAPAPVAQPPVAQPPVVPTQAVPPQTAGALASTNFNPQQGLTSEQTDSVQAAAQLLGNANVAHQPTRTSGQGNKTPRFSGPMDIQQPAVVDNGLTSHQGTLPVLEPERTHDDMRNQVTVRPPVTAPYTPQNNENPFVNPTGQKPGHAYNTGQFTPTQQQYGLSSNVDYRNRAMPANFGNISWDSAVPSLGDDPSINWDDFKRAFVSQVFDEFGDMLHKADPHVAGALVMRVFLEKMLRK